MGHFNRNDHYHRFLLRQVPATASARWTSAAPVAPSPARWPRTAPRWRRSTGRRPGGVLAVLGLSRPTLRDLPIDAVAFLPNRVRVALAPREAGPPPPVMDADLTLVQIRAQAKELLPGVRIRRHLYFRHSLVYRA
jgi:hypothetical protein